MTSRFGNRATGVAAATGIVLLVLLIVLLWTGVNQDFFRSGSGPKANLTGGRRGSLSENDFSDRTESEDAKKVGSKYAGSTREYVRPMKISPLGLNEEDLLYGSDQVRSGDAEPVQLRHHSGHFRHRTANIWDPHPIYEFVAFHKKFLLVLEHDSGFAIPDLKVTHIWQNSSTRKSPSIKSNGCFYKGYVKGDPSSSVAVSLCHGMTGNIRTSTGNYFIEPFEVTSDHAKPIKHVIYEMSESGKSLNHCGLDDYESLKFHVKKLTEGSNTRNSEILFDYETGDHRDEEADYSERSLPLRRSKRSASEEYFVEMLVVADSSMANYHGANTENYILALMYIVSGIFKDASIGNPITIAVVRLEIQYNLSFVKHRYPHDGVSAAEMLREFCHDQAQKNYNSEDSEFHHDTALLLTRENICRNASAQKCETLGLAELGTMCDKRSSCSLVQDNGLSAAFTIAHELGHVFNMPHDDAELKCRAHSSSDSVSHVMSTSLKEGTDPWSWSECSRHFVTEFLESRHSFCLRDKPVKDIIKENVPQDVFPGETIVGNRQCELLYGEGSRICSFMPVCSALWCNKLDSDGCQTLHMPWGDGTPCAEGAWCQKGVCVEKNREALKRVDGGWGKWQPYGSCSRSCGGGVKKSFRYCDNPRPRNGGRYCIGSRVQYKSCGTKDCPEGSKDFREEQCSEFNYNNHNIHGIPTNVVWVPKYGLQNDDRCVLYCRPYHGTLYYPLKDKVIDGTPCAPDSFDICVNGQCRPAGCDHALDSKVKLDLCGKCNGSNDTCRLMTGTFNESATKQGYRFVVTIPAGSSNLDIRQHGMNGVRDDNYLVLKDGQTGGRLLNNENVLTTFQKMIVYDGVTLEYSGCLRAVERINASRPLRRDLLVEVLSAGNLTPPNISYQYTVPLNNVRRYMWRYLDDEWESCDQVCNGRRKRKVVCVSVHTKEIIHNTYCRNSRQLSPIYEKCNTQCTLKWRVTSRSECSSKCGPGTRTVSKECIQEIVGEPKPYPVHNSSCAHLPDAPSDVEACEGPCSSVDWEYSEWSECSKTCNTGYRERDAYCVDKISGHPVEEERCDPLTKKVEEMCQTQPCPTWFVGEWSKCSVTCGAGTRTRGHWCQHENQVIDMSYCDAGAMPKHKETCMRRCTFWSYSGWGPCSATCGIGKRVRKTVCKNEEGEIVDNKECSAEVEPLEYEQCHQSQCPDNIEDNSIPNVNSHRRNGGNSKRTRTELTKSRWAILDWGPCSVTCGSGIRTKRVFCVTPDGRETNTCDPSKQPKLKSSEICNMRACPGQFKWVAGGWSPCTKTCGKGTQQRQVLCSNSFDRVYQKDEDCFHLGPKPESEKICWKPCPHRRRYKWKYGKWSACSKTCGYGEKVREVRCKNVTIETNEIDKRVITETFVDDRYCRNINRRRDKKKCRRKLCSHTWVEGEWSECSKKCGTGTQNRTVTCHQVNGYGWLDPLPLKNSAACDLTSRPPPVRNCTVMDCNSPFHWSAEEWQECTHTCGRKGTQRRTYKCRDRENRIRNKTDCSGLHKPLPKSRPCNRRPCGLMSCEEIQLHTNARTDGEYAMLVGGKNMSIYCKGMNTASPQEYLTLPYPDDNYSEYNDKRLMNPAACSGNGSETDSCECVVENHFGMTKFQKVRLLVETLQIRTDDFSFASSRGKPVPLGEAGDCCCEPSCPQGKFRIDLGGTSLQVAPIEKWAMKTSETFDLKVKFKGSQISGSCGGSLSGKSGPCGSCGPTTTGLLKLHVVPP